MHLVHIFMRGPFGIRAHCILGYFLRLPQGLNFVARTLLEYLPTILDDLLQRRQDELTDMVILYI